MNNEKRAVEEVARLRSKVDKPSKFKAVQDKLLFGGVLLVCGVIALVGFLPSHKKEPVIEAQEKQNTDQTLSQNMALLAQMKSTVARSCSVRLANFCSRPHDSRTALISGARFSAACCVDTHHQGA